MSATAPYTAGTRGWRSDLLRTSSRASSPAETVPATTIVVRTPSVAMMYGDSTL